MLSDINNMKDDIIQAMEIAQQSKPEPSPPVEAMNNTVQMNMMDRMTRAMENITAQLDNFENQQSNPTPTNRTY